MKRIAATVCSFFACIVLSGASAQTPEYLNYQGRLVGGTNLVNGTVGLTLRLWPGAFSFPFAQPLYEDSNNVTVVDGLYSTFLGDDTISGTLTNALTNATLYVEVAVNGLTLAPRERLVSSAYALRSANAANAQYAASAGSYTGAVSDAQLSSNIARLNGTNQTFSGVVNFTNLSNTFLGAFSGSGAGISNVALSSLNAQGVISPGPGWFAPASSPGASSSPKAVAAADVNGDGRTDLVAANTDINLVTILTNNGSGVFSILGTNGVGTGPESVAAADLNGDGLPDLVTANYGDNTLTVLTNKGGGQFVVSSSPGAGSGPVFVLPVDVNADGRMDLVAADYAGTLAILTNNGSAGFTLTSLPVVGAVPHSIAAADVNADGRMDLVCANFGGTTLSVLTNNGSGAFSVASSPGAGNGPRSVAAADLTGDGRPDLVTAVLNDHAVIVLTNNGAGGFVSNATYGVGIQPVAVAVADVNGDGRPDVVAANSLDNTLTVLTNRGGGALAVLSTPAVGSQPTHVIAADVNGDARPDLISANYDGNTLSILLNLPQVNGAFSGTYSGDGGGITGITGAGIVNGSISNTDLSAQVLTNITARLASNVWAAAGSTTNYVRRTGDTMTGSLTVGGAVTGASFNGGAFFGNGAGLTNLTFSGNGAGLTNVPMESLSPGGAITFAGYPEQNSGATFNEGQSFAIGDVNGDGWNDAVGGTRFGDFRTYLNNTNGGLTWTYTSNLSWNIQQVALGDFNGDGRLDASAIDSTYSAFYVLTNNGAGVFTRVSSNNLPFSGVRLVAADITGDGRPDLIAGSDWYTNMVTVFTNNGSGGFVSNATYRIGTRGGPLTCVDLTGDGKRDLVLGFSFTNAFTILTNRGSGTFFSNVTFVVGQNPDLVTAADVNRDGSLDLATVGGYTNLLIYTNNGAGGFTARPVQTLSESCAYVTAADANGDGWPDLVAEQFDSFSLWLNNGAGGFTNFGVSQASYQGAQTAAVDLNNDNRVDLVRLELQETLQFFLNTTGFSGDFDGRFSGDGSALTSAAGWYRYSNPVATTYTYNRVGIGTSSPTNTLDVAGNVGAFNYYFLSDSRAKENFADVDHESLLAKISAMKVSQWNYKREPGVLHIGPMAEDFHAAFGLGQNEVSISTSDEGGVALAGIQALNLEIGIQKSEIGRLAKENATKDAEIEALKARLDEVLQRLRALEAK